MRYICKEYLAEISGTTMYKDIDAGLLNKVVDKVGINKNFKVYLLLL
jgi:hypothetical protein